MFSASFVRFDMIIMVGCSTYGRDSVFEDRSNGLEFCARCGLVVTSEWAIYALYYDRVFFAYGFLGRFFLAPPSTSICFAALLDAYMPSIFADWACAIRPMSKFICDPC